MAPELWTGPLERIPARFERHVDDAGRFGGDPMLLRLFDDGRWLEGPAYFPSSRTLIFSDIPNDRLLRYDETTRTTAVFAQPAGYHNGHTVDARGRLVCCEHGNRRVTRVEPDGSTTVLADSHDGRRLNSPNDVVEHPDGSIWFTDPAYGIDTDYEGFAAEPEQPCYVYRVVPGEAPVVVADDFDRPNGLCFDLDHQVLYIVDSARHHLRRFDVDGDRLSGGEVIAECSAGTYDGIRIDATGRIWAATRDGAQLLAPDGTHLGTLHVPETVSNLTFGGPKRNDLYLTGATSLWLVRLNVTGAPFPR